MAVRLSFGLFATNKQPVICSIHDIESRISQVAKQGTYADSTRETLVYDTYEVLDGFKQLRMFLDLDIKRYRDGSPIPKLEGVVLAEHIKTSIETLLPTWESQYGRVAIGNSCGTKSRTEYCISFRIWFPCRIGSRKALESCARQLWATGADAFLSNVGDFRDKIDWEAFLDCSVYKNMGKLRLPGCTKQGEKHRPLLLDPELSSAGTTLTDCLVSFWKPEEVVALEEDALQVTEVAEPSVRNDTNKVPLQLDGVSRLTDTEYEMITNLADAIVDEWDRNATRFQIIAALWGLEPSGRMRTFIHSQAASKNPENSPATIEGQISRIVYEGVSAKTLLKFAWDADRTKVQSLKTKYSLEWQRFFDDLVTESDLINEIMVHQGNHWTLEEYSERYVRPYPIGRWNTIVVQSHMGTGKTVQLFDCIRSFRRVLVLSARRSYSAFVSAELLAMELGFVNYMDRKGHLSGISRLILQVESLHRIVWDYEPYDLIVMDESESLLFQMNSVGTHGEHHKENYEMLERIVRDARKVIAMDAFVTARTFVFLGVLRDKAMSLFIQNTFQPYDREGVELCTVEGRRVLPDFGGLVTKCEEFAAAGKRIVFVCASRIKGDYIATRLKGLGYSVLFHSSEDSEEDRAKLLNVREEWAKHQIVIYTTTITVGVSYSDVPATAEFDELFLYATASCALPRDIAQALLRARVIKSNRLWFCVEERCVKPAVVGFKAIQDDLSRRRSVLGDATWSDTPEWVLNLIAANENEIAVSRKYFGLVLKRYLRASGYTLSMPNVSQDFLQIEMESVGKPPFDEISNIHATEAEMIEERLMGGDASASEKLELFKYRFVGRFLNGEEGLRMAEITWNSMLVIPEGKKTSMETEFWNIVHEKQRNLETAWRAEADARYAEQAKTGLVRQKTMKELCGVLGIDHSCVEKSWTHEEFSRIAPRILEMEETLRKGLGLRGCQGKKKESEFMQASDILKQAFANWSGSVVEKVGKQKRINGEKKRLYDINISPFCKDLWKCLT